MGVQRDGSTDPDLLIDLIVATISRRLKASDIDEESAVKIAIHCGEEVRGALGGGTVYIPVGTTGRLKARDEQICKAFTGGNYMELAREHGLTEQRIRQILHRMRMGKARRA